MAGAFLFPFSLTLWMSLIEQRDAKLFHWWALRLKSYSDVHLKVSIKTMQNIVLWLRSPTIPRTSSSGNLVRCCKEDTAHLLSKWPTVAGIGPYPANIYRCVLDVVSGAALSEIHWLSHVGLKPILATELVLSIEYLPSSKPQRQILICGEWAKWLPVTPQLVINGRI